MPQQLIEIPVAIVGMACRLPGAADLSEFWKLLCSDQDAIGEFPPDRLDRDLYYSPTRGKRGKTYSTIGGLIPNRPLRKLPQLLSPSELDNADICHRILCEVALDAWEHAGWDNHLTSPKNTGVYIGHSGGSSFGGEMAIRSLVDQTLDYLNDVPDFRSLAPSRAAEVVATVAQKLRDRRPQRQPGGGPDLEPNYAAALIANVLKLTGPHFVIDAACASSLAALAAASMALNRGEVDAAIVGGASFNKADSLILFSHAHSCSAQGTRPFDSEADGLVSSEGYVVVVAKLLPRAIADGDRIHAVIRGIGMATDGRGRSLWAPRKEGQVEAIRRAYGGDVQPGDVQFVEAHATSTQVGDATELEALACFFGPHCGDRKLPLGSVKSHLGHTLETAGLAGLLKTILAMQHETIPPTANLRQLNPAVPWNRIPFVVPTSSQAWTRPHDSKPRCAAVNSFGIGGLNVHVVVEEFLKASPAHVPHRGGNGHPPSTSSHHKSSIAIVGRGVVLPGARTIAEFSSLLKSDRSQIVEAPADRWRRKLGLRPGACQPGSTPTLRGGFITDYEYDWKGNKVPPKQVAQANPLQFMLLDAAKQALVEAGYDGKPYDAERTAVIVGSAFGGEFGNDLQIGLRLPEIRRELCLALEARGLHSAQAERIADEFEQRILKAKPALLDETGSFTSSTLASRISKTLNLMGGAMAIDAGDCSSLAALSVACDLLHSGASSLVLCAAAQRAMDLPAFESLALHGRLQGCAANGEGYLPGEGVAVLLLKRLSDAERDGDRVLGVIEEVAAASDSTDLSKAAETAFRRAVESGPKEVSSSATIDLACSIQTLDAAVLQGLNNKAGGRVAPANSKLVQQIGHLQAAQGLVGLIKATLEEPAKIGGVTVHSASGLVYHAAIQVDGTRSAVKSSGAAVQHEPQPPAMHTIRRSEPIRDVAGESAQPRIICLSAVSPRGLREVVGNVRKTSPQAWAELPDSFRTADLHRIAVVACSADELNRKLDLLEKCGNYENGNAMLAEQGIYLHSRRGRPPRIVIAFPGQGSQYAGMLQSLVGTHDAARCALNEANSALGELGYPSFEQLAWPETPVLTADVLTTQLMVLVADYVAFAVVESLGLAADCFFGHSYGEFAALMAADVLDLRQAIRLTGHRANAIEQNVARGFGMLSIEAAPERIETLLNSHLGRVYISHHNAIDQVVVGGDERSLAALDASLSAQRIVTRRLSVPAPYHTPHMQSAVEPWRKSIAGERLRPAKRLLLSSVNNKYVSDPEDIRENLAVQLTTPVRYTQLVQRLVADGFDAIVEVGPNTVLSRLHRRILGDTNPIATGSLDHPRRAPQEQLCRVIAELSALGWTEARSKEVVEVRNVHLIEQFDATTQRRARNKNSAGRTNKPVAAKLEVFDATETRRSRHREAARHDFHATPTATGKHAIPSLDSRPMTASSAPSGNGSGTAASAVPASAARETATPNSAAPDIETILVDFVVEQTGYPADIIQLDWDLEADLGIDSIKRAQLFGELRELFHLENMEAVSLDEFRTLRQIADLLRSRAVVTAAGSAEATHDEVTRVAEMPPAAEMSRFEEVASIDEVTPAHSEHRDVPSELESRAVMERFLIDFVVEQTGYPADVVDLDADFEADLGIDSIKKAQLLGELREQFKLSTASGDGSGFPDFRTLRQILDALAGAVMATNQVAAEDAPLEKNELEEQPPAVTDLPDVGSIPQSDLVPTAFGPTAFSLPESSPPSISASETVTVFDDHPRYRMGFERGNRQAREIRALLCRLADSYVGPESPSLELMNWERYPLSEDDLCELRGVADGARVYFDNVVAYQRFAASDDDLRLLLDRPVADRETSGGQQQRIAPKAEIAHRYILRMTPAPLRAATQRQPLWMGDAVILGDNSLAFAIRDQIQAEGRRAHVIPTSEDPQESIRRLNEVWQFGAAPHLFLVTPRDVDAVTTWDSDSFDRRRRQGVTTPFWFCQRWMKLVADAGLMNGATIVGATSLGGDFGFSNQVHSVESGALTGLLKAIIIESWVAGHRTFPVKLIDSPPNTDPRTLVSAMWRELASPSYDCEIAWRDGERFVARAHRHDAAGMVREPLERGRVWVCTGGARGITAYVTRELAQRYDLKLHLLGLSPTPQIPDAWRTFSLEETKRFRIEVMQKARAAGANPVKEWEKIEKAIEIDRTLREFQDLGIRATYHSCDVADRTSLSQVLERIRREDGPIHGVLHGAGVGKDSRFDRKEFQRVEDCLRAKIDGARALMELTRNDPLKYFVAFGSISGRFGANGHTDYSLANDMLCKEVDWYRRQRPEVKSIAFHWHAWGDVGMATKPETKLALEMVGMQFMPAAEGLQHLIDELESPAADSEVLITDDKYYRVFYPAETLVAESSGIGENRVHAMLDEATVTREGDKSTAILELDPTREVFLIEHRLDDRPLLPIVVGMELLAEAGSRHRNEGSVTTLRNVRALQGLRFFTDRPQSVRVTAENSSERSVQCELLADFFSRDGRLIESNRHYLEGTVEFGSPQAAKRQRRFAAGQSWSPVDYPPPGSKMYLGKPLQCLKRIQLQDNIAIGQISAPALVELAGATRRTEGWIIPSAALDSCLFATGILCWNAVAPGPTLPVSFGLVELGRKPQPGELCIVEIEFIRRVDKTAMFNFTLFGDDGSPIVHVEDYRVAWLGG